MQFYRDDQGTFHRTQAEAKASGRPWKPMDVPTDHKGLCEFLNLLNPPIELLPQIRALLAGNPIEMPEPEEATWSGDALAIDAEYREGQPTKVFNKSRDPQAIFNCSFCGKQNNNRAI